jgi:hypothetical protein
MKERKRMNERKREKERMNERKREKERHFLIHSNLTLLSD